MSRKPELRTDLEALNRAIDQYEKARESFPDEEITAIHALNSKVPAPVRGVAGILSLLPPSARIFGLALILAFVAFAIWRGVTWAG